MAERSIDQPPLQPTPVPESQDTGGLNWLRRCVSNHGRWALTVALLIVLPTWLYLRSQKAAYEATSFFVLPFSAEARAEASDSEFGQEQARTAHVAILRLYIDTLDRHDLVSVLDLGRPAQLRRKLISIADELEQSEKPGEAIRKAADRTFALYEEFDGRTFNLPTINPMKDGAVLLVLDEFSRTSHLFEHTMKDSKASYARKAELCELDCMNSRRAFLVLLCRWKEYREKERAPVIDQYVNCQNRSVRLTESLAQDLSKTDPDKAVTLGKYAASMKRRLETIAAMKEGNYDDVIQILKRSQNKT